METPGPEGRRAKQRSRHMSPGNSTDGLRISMIVSGFPALSQTFVSLQLAELVGRGHQVDVYSLGQQGRWEWLPASIGNRIDDVRIHYLGTRAHALANVHFLLLKVACLLARNPRAVWLALKRNLVEGGYKGFARLIADAYVMRDVSNSDIVHCQFVTLASRVLDLRELGFIEYGPRLICSVRDYDISKRRPRSREFRASAFDGVDRFLPVCRKLELVLREKGCEGPIPIVRSPVDVDHIQSIHTRALPGEPLQLLSIGRLVEKKGIIDALDAMLILKAQGADFRYSIIGDGVLKSSLRDYVVAHKLTDRVHFLGSLPPAETLSVLESAHILVAPSTTAGDGDSEGIPNVLKEAILIGVQVVSTTHSGIPELIRHQENGYLCAENDPEGLARLIQFVAGNSEEWENVAKRSATTILAECTPEETTDNLTEAYRLALTSSASRAQTVFTRASSF